MSCSKCKSLCMQWPTSGRCWVLALLLCRSLASQPRPGQAASPERAGAPAQRLVFSARQEQHPVEERSEDSLNGSAPLAGNASERVGHNRSRGRIRPKQLRTKEQEEHAPLNHSVELTHSNRSELQTHHNRSELQTHGNRSESQAHDNRTELQAHHNSSGELAHHNRSEAQSQRNHSNLLKSNGTEANDTVAPRAHKDFAQIAVAYEQPHHHQSKADHQRQNRTDHPRDNRTNDTTAHEEPDRGPHLVEAWLYGNILKYAYYYTELFVGSPHPQKTSVIVDTGSHLVGFPCKGCEQCGDHKDPAFDFSRSSSAAWLNCSASCDECRGGECHYRAAYSEGSKVSGRWFRDVLRFRGPGGFGKTLSARLGCHARESRLFFTQRADGIMGLAPAASSRILMPHRTILHDLFRDEGERVNASVFSLCFSSWGGRFIIGGHKPSYSGNYTPGKAGAIHWLSMMPNLYYIVYPTGMHIEDLVVGVGRAAFGATIVDSGTTFSLFPGPLYLNMYNGLHTHCNLHGCNATQHGEKCWRVDNLFLGPMGFPNLRMEFGLDGDVEWPPQAYMHQSEFGPDIWCLSFEASSTVTTVLGISWMLHKDIIFDLDQQRLGVVRTVCPEKGRPENSFLMASSASYQRSQIAPSRRKLAPGTVAAALALFILTSMAALLLLRRRHGMGAADCLAQSDGEFARPRARLVCLQAYPLD